MGCLKFGRKPTFPLISRAEEEAQSHQAFWGVGEISKREIHREGPQILCINPFQVSSTCLGLTERSPNWGLSSRGNGVKSETSHVNSELIPLRFL